MSMRDKLYLKFSTKVVIVPCLDDTDRSPESICEATVSTVIVIPYRGSFNP